MAAERSDTAPPPGKRFLLVARHAPHGTAFAAEGLDALLAFAAFDQDVGALFLDDGVWQLAAGQAPAAIGMRDFARGFRALADLGVARLYVERESLAARGLDAGALLLDARIVSRAEAAALAESHDVVLGF